MCTLATTQPTLYCHNGLVCSLVNSAVCSKDRLLLWTYRCQHNYVSFTCVDNSRHETFTCLFSMLYDCFHKSIVCLVSFGSHKSLWTMMWRQYRVGCVVANVHKQVMPESCHHLTASHAHSHLCLVSLLYIPSLYSTLF